MQNIEVEIQKKKSVQPSVQSNEGILKPSFLRIGCSFLLGTEKVCGQCLTQRNNYYKGGTDQF